MNVCPVFSPQTSIDRYKADLSALTNLCEEMKKLYSSVLVTVAPSQGVRDVRVWLRKLVL